jgi:Calcineurin-like phosphoesterase
VIGSKLNHDGDTTEDDLPLFDPRRGDAEDDISSPKQRSLLALAGGLLAEISLPKLVVAWTFSIFIPALWLGFAPLAASAFFLTVSRTVVELTGLGAALILLAVAGLGWIAWRPFLRTVEINFWSLNALAIQPSYAFCREALRYLSDRMLGKETSAVTLARVRAISSAAAAVILCFCGALIATAVWPASRWVGTAADLFNVHRFIVPTLANTVFVVSAYFSVASLAWGLADASMAQPMDLAAFDDVAAEGLKWRIAHLSDIHQVGEQYGFRIESGRRGPRGNGRFARIMEHLEAIHNAKPLDLVLISGDMTDVGRATEWAEFLDAVALYPAVARRTIILPGNHDLNIVDRMNPARLELPFSSGKRLRQMRALSAMAVVQGPRVLVIDPGSQRPDRTLTQAIAPHRKRIAEFADIGGVLRSAGLGQLWNELFPMILPPATADGLGVAILNSNAETHFSFTNALGVISAEQTVKLIAALERFPRARWIIALHHHLVEYPSSVAAFSERVGTALVNGSWFIRKLIPFAARIIIMHGHRHIDWIGACGQLRIISAPSPVMGATDEASTYFHIHTLIQGPNGRVCLLPPDRVEIPGADGAN